MEYKIELKVTQDGVPVYTKEVRVSNTDKATLIPLAKIAVVDMARKCEESLK